MKVEQGTDQIPAQRTVRPCWGAPSRRGGGASSHPPQADARRSPGRSLRHEPPAGDYDADYPPAARAFKKAIADVDGVLFVTPEYNRSIPGGLEDAIDRASRPHGENSFRPFRGGALQYPLSQYVSGPDPISVLSSIW